MMEQQEQSESLEVSGQPAPSELQAHKVLPATTEQQVHKVQQVFKELLAMMEPPEPLGRREVLVPLAQSVPQVLKDRQVYKALQVRLAQLAL